MKRKTRLVALLVALSLGLVSVLFVPVLSVPGGGYTSCSSNGCIHVIQYESLSYQTGGWGAVFQSGVNRYSLRGWMCSCPAQAVGRGAPCCVPPLAGAFWPAMGMLLLADASGLFMVGRLHSGAKKTLGQDGAQQQDPESMQRRQAARAL